MTESPTPRRFPRSVPVVLAFIAVFFAAINLRAGIASLGSVLGEVLEAFNTSGALAGVITAMPGLFFAIMGLGAVPLAARFGLSKTLTVGMVLTLIGLAVRPWVGEIWIFIALTAFVVAGIALANVLLPAWIKNHGGRHIVALMTIYSSVLGLSGAIGPLSILLFNGNDAWRWSLFIWASFAAVQLVVWVIVAARTGFDFPSASADTAAGNGGSLWKSPTAVFLMLFFGLQSMNAYIQMGWLPQIFIDGGASANVGSVALALVGALNVIGGLVMPLIIDRVHNLAIFPVLFSVCSATGYVGLYFTADTVPLLWALFLGLGGFCFPTAIALIPARSRSPLVTARLSGFVQPVGYFVAALGPFLIGIIYEATGQWSAILLTLVGGTVAMAVTGFRASRRGYIDDELNAASR
ncbi:MFS transporter [Corynebacterium halotolerans]|uniref:MFS transporter n=1 Tax=Corynebacterium halotolerans TaxID=225326 RepID=UPI003CF76F12